MPTTGSGGTDLKRMLAYEGTSSEPATAAIAPAAVPFGAGAAGAGAPRYELSIDALTARQKYVKRLIDEATVVLGTANEAFLAGASTGADRAGARALEGWFQRLVTEDEHLDIEIRRFNEAEGAKAKKKPR